MNFDSALVSAVMHFANITTFVASLGFAHQLWQPLQAMSVPALFQPLKCVCVCGRPSLHQMRRQMLELLSALIYWTNKGLLYFLFPKLMIYLLKNHL